MDFSKERVIATAIHEAGHAATAFFLGREVESASISPARTDGGLRRGHCTTRPRGRSKSKLGLHDFEEDIVISFGGPIAQFELETERALESDMLPEEPYKKLLDHLHGDSAAVKARMAELKALAVDIAGRADVHRAAQAIAQRLLYEPHATIPGSELRGVYDTAIHSDVPRG